MACEGTMYDWSGIYFQKEVHASATIATAGFVVYMIATPKPIKINPKPATSGKGNKADKSIPAKIKIPLYRSIGLIPILFTSWSPKKRPVVMAIM